MDTTRASDMAKSWGWSLTLSAAVPDQETVDVPTPGYDAELTDAASIELAVANQVIPDEQGEVVFNGDSASVTNLSGEDWEAGDLVYIYAEALPIGDVANLEAMQEQIEAQQSEIDDLQARVATLEGGAADEPAARTTPQPKKAKAKR